MSTENRETAASENQSRKNRNYSNNKKHENHNYRRHRSNHESGSGTGSEQELESLRIEYQNLFDRSNKLDNKVYITVTFLGFMFVFITSLFGSIPQLQFTGSSRDSAMSSSRWSSLSSPTDCRSC